MKASIFLFLSIVIPATHDVAALQHPYGEQSLLRVAHDAEAGRIEIYRVDGSAPVLTQVALPDERPYLHPIVAPDGIGILTEYRPSHHPHQTGVYWGLKRVNERDFFMGWQSEYWRRTSASVLEGEGQIVRWEVVYDLLNENGDAVLTETHTWSMQAGDDTFLIDLRWQGEARQELTVGEFYVGGLFVRMPWVRGIDGEVVNAGGQRNRDAEGRRSIWADVGLAIDGRSDKGHVAIFDHPENKGFPSPFRVDGELGVGPSRQILGDWHLAPGETEEFRYRLYVYTGSLDAAELTRAWTAFAAGD